MLSLGKNLSTVVEVEDWLHTNYLRLATVVRLLLQKVEVLRLFSCK